MRGCAQNTEVGQTSCCDVTRILMYAMQRQVFATMPITKGDSKHDDDEVGVLGATSLATAAEDSADRARRFLLESQEELYECLTSMEVIQAAAKRAQDEITTLSSWWAPFQLVLQPHRWVLLATGGIDAVVTHLSATIDECIIAQAELEQKARGLEDNLPFLQIEAECMKAMAELHDEDKALLQEAQSDDGSFGSLSVSPLSAGSATSLSLLCQVADPVFHLEV